MQLEICIDNVESLEVAANVGVTRLELCAALAVGGLTPSYAFIKQAVALSKAANFVMIRPRAGDFIFNPDEVDVMVADIHLAKDLGADGVVIGALTQTAEIDLNACEKLMQAAQGMGVTFHRAFDLCRDPHVALEQLIALGCERLLTSGQAPTAWQGRKNIAQQVIQSQGRIQIMPGAGVTAKNAKAIITATGADALHFSAKGYRQSLMPTTNVSMGQNQESDRQIMLTDRREVQAIQQALGLVSVTDD